MRFLIWFRSIPLIWKLMPLLAAVVLVAPLPFSGGQPTDRHYRVKRRASLISQVCCGRTLATG